LIEEYLTLILCPTAIWQRNATTVAGSKGGTSGSSSSSLNYPTDVHIDNNSNIYVVDAENYRVQRFPSNSTIATTVLNGSYGIGLYQFAFSKFKIV
jgi:hypothetical protein